MKAGFKSGWKGKLSGAVLACFFALPVSAQLMLAHEGHHDAGGCTIKTGEFPVTFSAYEVPEGNIPPMHSFCENLPNPGKVNLTIELPHEAREFPMAVRVVLEGHSGHGSKHDTADQKSAEKEMDHSDHEGMNHDEHDGGNHGASSNDNFYMAPMVHKSGIIVIATNLTERGKYNITLEKDDGAGNSKPVVTIPLNVGKGGGHGSHGGGFGMVEIVLLLAAAGGGAFYFIRRKKSSETAA